VRVAAGGPACLLRVQADPGVAAGMHQAVRGDGSHHGEHEPAVGAGHRAAPRPVADQFLARVAHVPGFLGHVQPCHRPGQRIDPLVGHGLPLHLVEQFLDEQGCAERERPVGDRLEHPAEGPRSGIQPVMRGTHLLDELREHDRVAALVADLGIGVLDVAGGGVAVVGMPDQHLHQDRLEPDADVGDAGYLLAAQFFPLRLGEPVPQRRAVQRHAVGRHRVVVLADRPLPVDLRQRVVGGLRR
jgi:hypothetical protein